MIRKFNYILISVILFAPFLRAQDVHFSQYYASPTLMNPATTGSFDAKMRAVVNYRTQWLTVGKPYSTYSASYEIAILKKKQSTNYLGLGLNFMQDKAGLAAFKRMQANLAVAYNLQLNEANNIALGIQGGYDLRSINTGGLTWDSQYNGSQYVAGSPSGESIAPAKGTVDIGAGLLWHYQQGNLGDMNVGFSALHLKPMTHSFAGGGDKLPMKFTLHGQGRFTKRSSDIAYYPNFLVALQGRHREINAGIMLRYMLQQSSKYTGFIRGNAVYVGANYRVGDAAIIIVALEISDWKIGISYDVNISKFSKATSTVGGFEISLVYLKVD